MYIYIYTYIHTYMHTYAKIVLASVSIMLAVPRKGDPKRGSRTGGVDHRPASR